MKPIDIVLLVHNRLDHLVRTVDALEQRTPEPIRLTIVDNASGPETRSWLTANRGRFERILFRATNVHLRAFDDGIAATTSDPFLVSDPDLIVPDLSPSWLARLLDLLERHPDFGLIGVGLDQSNRPSVLPPERIDPATVVDGSLVEGDTGGWFQALRRSALPGPYRSDMEACASLRAAGYRVGWTPDVRALHLGWEDYARYPRHLSAKHELGDYTYYAEVEMIPRPPTLSELAIAAPVLAHTRAAGVPDSAILELAWGEPAIGAAVEGPVTLMRPAVDLPLAEDAAGAVVLLDPPAESLARLLNEACRVAARLVVLVISLEAVAGAPADELAPTGWLGVEHAGIGDIPLALARSAAASAAVAGSDAYLTIEDREQWLRFFAAGAFGPAARRLFIFDSPTAGRIPDAVAHDPERVDVWRPDHAYRHGRRWRGHRLRRRVRSLAERAGRRGTASPRGNA